MRYRFRNVEVDLSTQEIERDGEPIHTERQVFAVLEYLITHRHRVVPKIELLDEIWQSRFVSESALTSRIKSARQACGDNGRDQAVIRTVHGTGYRFVADITADDAPPSVTPVRSVASSGLIGRDGELAEVDEAADRSALGHRTAVFVTGPAGIGKSAFVAAATERICDASGWHLLRGQTLRPRGAVEPYFPILDALARAARAGDDAVAEALDRVAPMWLAQLPALTAGVPGEQLERRLLGANPDRMVREGAELIEELARSGPVALVLEDLHWADECTLDVIDLLLQRSEPCRLIVLGSARNERAPVLDLIRYRSGARQATQIELGELGADEVDRLVIESFDGADVADQVLDIVRRRSDGIPLFALEIVRGWRRLGHLAVEGHEVRCSVSSDELESHLPDNLRALVEHDLARLDGRTTELLEMAAVVGFRFDAASVAASLGEPVDAVDVELTAMARQLHQIVAVGGSMWPDGTASTRFEFSHDLFRQVLHDRVPAHAAVRSHGAVGRALEAGFAGRLNEIAGLLAVHFVAAGDHVRAVEYLRMLGEISARKNAFVAATDALLAALEHIGQIPDSADRDAAELRVRLALGPPLVATRGWYGAEVAENYERALEICTADEECADSAVARYSLATVTELRGEYARTEELLEPLISGARATGYVGGMDTEAKELLACSAFHQGKFELSVDMASAVLDVCDDSFESEMMSRLAEHPVSACCSWASLSTWCLGRIEESLQLADRAITVGGDHLYALSTAQVQRAMLHQLRREPDDCRRWAESARQLAQSQGFPMRAVQAEMLLGWGDAMSGEPGGADRIRTALAAFLLTGARLSEPYFLGLIAEAELVDGRPEEAVTVSATALAEMTRGSRTFFAAPELHRIAAVAMVACDRHDDARRQFELAATTANELGSPVLEVRALADAARSGCLEQHGRERLTELVDQVEDGSIPDRAELRRLLAAIG
jgi:DNA-binding winged helix-turn-helix (wHTH) protein/tetratricopeptide (TPR) repeat protein